MRTMKAIVTGMSAATLAMIMACGMGTTADAAGTATFDASTQTMAVKGTGAEVMVSFDAIKAAKTGVTWNAKAKWDIYDGGSKAITVDLSTLKVAKDMYVAVKDNTSDLPNVYHISPDETKLAGKYEVASKASKLTFTDNKAAVDTEETMLEYRTENANEWTEYVAKDFPMNRYEQQGATLYFRKAAAENMKATAEKDAPEDQPYTMNEVAGGFATKEIKVKVTKMANAPAATIDYDKGTFKMKTGTEYRFVDDSGFVAPDEGKAGDFTAAPADLLVSIDDITQDGAFEIRTAVSDKKVASKIAVYAYKGVPTPKAGDVAVDPAEGSEKLLNITYGKDTKGKNQVTFNSKNANASYLIYTVDPSVAENAKAKPLVTLKKSGEKGYKDVVVAETKLPKDTVLYVVTASDKKTEVFRSKVLKNAATIAYPDAPTPAPSTEPAE